MFLYLVRTCSPEDVRCESSGNGFIITWILHQIYKVKLEVAKMTTPPPIYFSPSKWTNLHINYVHVSNLYWRQFFPCHNIQEFCIIVYYPLFRRVYPEVMAVWWSGRLCGWQWWRTSALSTESVSWPFFILAEV